MSYQQQPLPQPAMTTMVPIVLPNENNNEFKNGICGCGGAFGTFCLSWFCPCITYGRLNHRYKNPGSGSGECCNSDCMIHALLTSCGFGFVMQFMLRGNIRERYNINGGACGDCLAAFCCTPCELTQEWQELEYQEARPQGKV